ncbi:MAG: hypothetical protein LH473_05680 [Chitinophagales bacterium]|nr:hypothetical protein [Chitinophagales bacterium]
MEGLQLVAFLMLINVALNIIIPKKLKDDRINKGEAILSKLLDLNLSSELLAKEIAEEYGVKIEIESGNKTMDDEYADWIAVSKRGLEKAYGTDEPDYDDALIVEKNPNYSPWKKGM